MADVTAIARLRSFPWENLMMTLATPTFRFVLLVALAGLSFSGDAGIRAADKDKPNRPAVGEEAADFELKTLDAETVKLSKLVADGPVVLIVLRGYPGYQCPACTAQMGQFLSNAKKFEALKTRVVMVYPGPADDLKKHADDFVRGKTLPDNFSLALDPDYEFTMAYRLRWEAKNETAYPSTFVIDRERKITFAKISMSHGGRASMDEVLKALSGK